MRHVKRALALKHKVFILRTFYQCNDADLVQKEMRANFNIFPVLDTISCIVDNFELTGSVNQSYFYESKEEREILVYDQNGESIVFDVVIEEMAGESPGKEEKDDPLQSQDDLQEKEEEEEIKPPEESIIEEQEQEAAQLSTASSTSSEDEEEIETDTEPTTTKKSPASSSSPVKNQQREKCTICEKEFSSRYLWKHMKREHEGKKIYNCPDCKKTFTGWPEFKAHKREHSKQEQPKLKCEYCDKLMANTSTYNRHKKTHLGLRNQVCSVCGKAFQEAVTLKLHMRCHTGEKPYGCDHCDRRFATKSSQLIHNRVHTGERPYKCNYCEKAFTDSSTRSVSIFFLFDLNSAC